MLQNKLKNKKYLLVIDGEVSGTEWKHFLTSIPVGTRGSRVVHIIQGKPKEQAACAAGRACDSD